MLVKKSLSERCFSKKKVFQKDVFLKMFSESIEMKHWLKMGYFFSSCCDSEK